MERLFEGFEILCTDYDHMLEKSGDIIQGRKLFKEIRYLNFKAVLELPKMARTDQTNKSISFI